MPNTLKNFIVIIVTIIATISFIVAVQKHQEKTDDAEAIIGLKDLHVAPIASSKSLCQRLLHTLT